MKKKNKKNPKVCILCKHWRFDPGDAGYSEMTPGYDWSMECSKTKWRMSGFDISQEDYRQNILMANTCKKFEAYDY